MQGNDFSIEELEEKINSLISENMKLSKLNATLNFKLYATLKEI